MAKSRLSYAEAVRLLTGGDDRVTVLSRLAGGVLLLATPFVPGALSLFDAKGEANALLRDLVGAAPARIRASSGRRHYELIEAAHAVLVASCFFDALAEQIPLGAFELTDDEKRRICEGGAHPLRALDQAVPPMPGVARGCAENLPAIQDAFRRMYGSFAEFVSGLAAATTLPPPAATVVLAREMYRERYVRLAADLPEFAMWAQLGEHAATRTEVRRQSETLTRMAELLAAMTSERSPAAAAVQTLARHYRQGLRRPLWRADAPAPDGLSFPTVEQGFISPRFRLTVADKKSRLGDESWWEEREARDDLAAFLAGYLADPGCTQRPLVVLGHPGAGKSLLTEVMAARLPPESFTTVRVPLRRVDPDAPIYQQVEAAIEALVKERISWGDLCRASPGTKVVLLDGFDELVQATGVTQSHYVDLAATFQQEEWINGRPVAVVISSRTLVMDRTVVRDGTLVIKLEPFDEGQVGRWTEAWNAANDDHPLTVEELWRHRDLTGQPLLLMMLAVYAAEAGGLDADDLSTDQLYRRLLDSFIRRQVRDKAPADLGETRFADREAESRRDLAAVAFAMFNRGRQYIGEDDLERDLHALHPESPSRETSQGEPVSRARRTVAAFFFVHVAQTDDEQRTSGRRSYEFLHATFAEYLVAEHTAELLANLAEDWGRSRRRTYGASLDDRVLRALLSHQPLTNGEQIVPFLETMLSAWVEPARADLREALLELFRAARRNVPDDPYRPTPFDVIHRTAAYTANLVLLAALCGRDGIDVEELCGHPDAPGIETTVRLWRSGLDAEAQNGYYSRLRRTGTKLSVREAESRWPQQREAELIGDIPGEAVLIAGLRAWLIYPGGAYRPTITEFQRDFHDRVVELVTMRWPIASLRRLTPYDERLYERLAGMAETGTGEPHPLSIQLLTTCLMYDSPHLPAELVDRLVVSAVLRPAEHRSEPVETAALLALNHPELVRRHPGLMVLVHRSELAALLHATAVANRHKDPGLLDPIIADLHAVAVASPELLQGSVTAPSMVTGLPELLPQVLASLREYGDLAWSQVSPADLLASLSEGDDALVREVRKSLVHYVGSRDEDDFEGVDAAAFERLRELAFGLPPSAG